MSSLKFLSSYVVFFLFFCILYYVVLGEAKVKRVMQKRGKFQALVSHRVGYYMRQRPLLEGEKGTALG